MIHGRGETEPQEANILSLLYAKHREMKQEPQTEVLLLKILSLTSGKISTESSTLHIDISTGHMSPVKWPFS